MSLILSGTDGLSDVDGTAATPAIRGTDANTGIFFPAADTIAFAEGGAEVARFDSAGNLGIGETNPTQKIHFKGSSTTYAFAETTGSGTSSGFRMKAGAGTDFTLFTTQGGNQFGIYNNTTSTQPLTINANGALALLGGSTSATGVGITFPATQSASTDANTLDDYEEGTYTPTFTSMTVNSGSAVYSGKYTKIGNLCYAMFGTTGTQNITAVAGTTQFSLPFVSSGVNFSAGLGSGPGLAQNGSTTATSGLQGPTNGASGGYFIQGLAATSSIVGSITYHTA